MLGYHALAAEHVESVIERGLHAKKTRDWGYGIAAAGQGVYLASSPKLALNLGQAGGMAVCEIDPKNVVADEDEVPRVIQAAIMAVAPRFDIKVFDDDDGWGGTIRIYDESDFARVLGERPGQFRDATADAFCQLLETRSSFKADAVLSRRAVEAFITFNKRLTPFGGPYPGIFDVPPDDAALIAYKAAEHEICFRHRDLGSRGRRGAPWSFRVMDDLGYVGPNRILAVLSLNHDDTWRVEAGELTVPAESALRKARLLLKTEAECAPAGPPHP